MGIKRYDNFKKIVNTRIMSMYGKYSFISRIIKVDLLNFWFIPLAILIIFINMIMSTPAWGHKVSIFAYVKGNKIMTEGYFNDGTPCKDSLIQVFDTEGKELVNGNTDGEGLFSFNIPNNLTGMTDLKIVLTAGLGHKAEYILPSSEMHVVTADNTDMTDRTEVHEESSVKNDELYNKGPVMQTLTRTDLDQIHRLIKESVEKSVEEATRPLIKALAKAEATRISLPEIIGGIGYIFGIMGIIIYFKKRDN